MKPNAARLLKIAVIAGIVGAVTTQAELVRHPVKIGTNIDFGQIVSGETWDNGQYLGRAEDQVITRTGVYLTESGTYDDRLTFRMSIGGLFWYQLPEGSSFKTRIIQFGPGVGQAQGIYSFGEDPKNPSATLQFGLFPHKYSDATNLGEYLYRSGAYPGYLMSGGWSFLNSASYLAQGVRFQMPMLDGKLRHSVSIYMERNIEPAHDLSPGYEVSYKPVPFVELGAGVVWAHGIPIKPKKVLSPKNYRNAYNKATGLPYADEGSYLADSNVAQGYYSYRGFKAMGRASLDVGMLLGVDEIRKGDFKLYTETALLGIENQPYYYEKRSERMPMMMGLNIPTFGLLDRFAVEVEYYKNKFPNNIGAAFEEQNPIPLPIGVDPFTYSDSAVALNEDNFTRDDWKWSVYGSRKIVNGVTVYAQAASDHLRHPSVGAINSYSPWTVRPQDWYYVFRLEFGI
jgi:hypothetical protein